MPNKKTHLLVSLLLGLIAGFLLYNDLIYALIFTLLSGLTATLPDQLEKPTHSLHRGFFHSIVFLIVLVIVLSLLVWTPLSGLVFGYITHLLLDFARGKHKPII